MFSNKSSHVLKKLTVCVSMYELPSKLTFLTAEKIILKANVNVEIIKTYILNLEHKLSLSAFFCGSQN